MKGSRLLSVVLAFLVALAAVAALAFVRAPATAAPLGDDVLTGRGTPASADPRPAGWSYRLRLERMLRSAAGVSTMLPDLAGAATAAPAAADAARSLASASLRPAGIGGAAVGLARWRSALATQARPAATVATASFATPVPTLDTTVLNVLLMGSDRRPRDGSWRTDTLVVVSIDQTQRRVGLLSVPRDLWVDIPGYGQGRINTADYLGTLGDQPDGQLIKDTVAQNLGVPIHRFVRVNFQAFVAVVDALGGIDLAVDCPLEDYFLDDGVGGAGEVSLDTGLHHVDGTTALRYARSRHSTSDFDRSRRQQRVLRAMAARAREKGLLRSAPRLLASVREHVQTDVSLTEMLALGVLAARVSDVSIHAGQLDFRQLSNWTTAEGAQVLLADPAAVATKLGETLAGAGTADEAAPVHTDRVVLVDHTGRDGWPAVAAMRLGERRVRLTTTRTGAAESGTAVYFEPAAEGSARAALAALGLDESALRPMDELPPAVRLAGDVQVVLGADWAPDCP